MKNAEKGVTPYPQIDSFHLVAVFGL